jgi:hypothetical protein
MTETQEPQGAGVSPPDDPPGAGQGQAGSVPGGAGPAQEPNPLASPQLAESPQSDIRTADDPLGGKQPADDPLGSDPLTLDRRNPQRGPGQ